MILHSFQPFFPRFSSTQEEASQWLAKAYSKNHFENISELLDRYGVKSDQINRRYHLLDDFCHSEWSQMTTEQGMEKRMDFFKEAVNAVFDVWYAEETSPPDEIIHVTCTGYVSPSAGQNIVSKKNWGHKTSVFHAYHMGCYAAIPALKHAKGSLAQSASRVDIAHTELCTLHFKASLPTAEQLVVQTLFADGLVRFQASSAVQNGLEVIHLLEEILPDSEKDMIWFMTDGGMQMSLSRNVPLKIRDSVRPFTERLLAMAELSIKDISCFAIHPGGPKIIDRVRDALEIDEKNVQISRKILRDYGNMSSATLPFMWKTILEDSQVPNGALILSLAFGPGLTVVGAIMRKISP